MLDFKMQVSSGGCIRLCDDGCKFTIGLDDSVILIDKPEDLDSLQSAMYVFRNALQARIDKAKQDAREHADYVSKALPVLAEHMGVSV